MGLDSVTVEFSTLAEALGKQPPLPTPIRFVMVGRFGSYLVCANTPEQYQEQAVRAYDYLSLSESERRVAYLPIPCRG